MKIYVASSWRNDYQSEVVAELRADGHEVYDFKNPEPGDDGFHWSEIDGGWKSWSHRQYIDALMHPVAIGGFGKDWRAMQWADAFVLVQPCGRSAHLELGWAVGAGKPTSILLRGDVEPELMAKMADFITDELQSIRVWAKGCDQIIYSKPELKDLGGGCPDCGHRHPPDGMCV